MYIRSEILNLIEGLTNDKIHGASELARQAANVLKIAAERSKAYSTKTYLQELTEIGRRLMSARPAMAPIYNMINYVINSITEKSTIVDLGCVRQHTISIVDEVITNSLQAVIRIAKYSAELINDGDHIMTNSYSSTITAAMKEAFCKHNNVEVVVTRSGPNRSGERIAQELANFGVPVTLIDDAAMGSHLKMINMVVVGTDRVCVDSTIINGVGTYQLALASSICAIPFYVLSEMLKFDARLNSYDIDLEDKEPSEVVPAGRLSPEVRVRNPHFDIIPLELVTGVITEEGLITRDDVKNRITKLPH